MSEIGALSHTYIKWNTYLGEINEWLLEVRKMKDGLIPATESVEIPKGIHTVLADLANAFTPKPTKMVSRVPLTIRQKLDRRLEERTDILGQRLSVLLEYRPLLLDDITDEDIDLLRSVVACIDDEVTGIYNRIHRYR